MKTKKLITKLYGAIFAKDKESQLKLYKKLLKKSLKNCIRFINKVSKQNYINTFKRFYYMVLNEISQSFLLTIRVDYFGN